MDSATRIDWASPTATNAMSAFITAGIGSPDKPPTNLQRWSSLIGIVTAICGNILISFALNIQRYAHIRLRRERLKKARKEQFVRRASGLSALSASRNTEAPKNGNGTNGSSIKDAAKKAQKKTTAADYGDTLDDDDYMNGDTDPLIQSFTSAGTYESSSSMEGLEEDIAETFQDPLKTYLHSPYWWAGIIVMIIGEAGNFLAYGFAPASIVSPLGVVALVSNCIIAPVMLKERFRQRDLWGVLTAITGAVVVVLSAKQKEKKLGAHEIWGAINRWEFQTYVGITVTLITIGMWASNKYGDRTVLIDLGLVALFGGYTVLSTKGVSSLLSFTFFRMLTFPITYPLLVILISTAFLQIKYLNRALQRFDSTQVIPTQFVLFTLSVIIGSAVLYRDFEKTTAEQMSKFVAGCLLTFTGVYFITSNRKSSNGNEEELGPDEERAYGLVAEDERFYNDAHPIGEDDVYNGRKADDARVQNGLDDSDADDALPLPRGSLQYGGVSYSGPATPRRKVSISSKGSSEVPGPSRAFIPSGASSLLENPWRAPDDEPPSATLSRSGLLETPTESMIQTESSSRQEPADTPLTRSTSHPHAEAHEREEGSTPSARNSIHLMMPGPLFSPFSSSLSAVVADELRRSVDLTPSPSRRRFGGSLRLPRSSGHHHEVSRLTRSARKSKSARLAEPEDADSTAAGTGSLLKKTQSADAEEMEGSGSAKGRARSLSTTLGDFIRRKRVRSGTLERRSGEDESLSAE